MNHLLNKRHLPLAYIQCTENKLTISNDFPPTVMASCITFTALIISDSIINTILIALNFDQTLQPSLAFRNFARE